MDPLVYLIVLNWNGKRFLRECLNSIGAQSYKNIRVILADNGSSDGSAEFVAEAFPSARVLRFERNRGFSAPNNAAAEIALAAGAHYIAFVNNDLVLMPDTVEKLVAAGETRPRAGGLCPVQYYYEQPDAVMAAGGRLDLKRGAVFMNKRVLRPGVYETEFLSGAFLMAKSEALRKCGLLDPEFYFYFEDADLSLRLLRAGYQNICVAGAKVLHHVGASSHDSRFTYYHSSRTRLIFVRKHADIRQKLYFAGFYVKNVIFGELIGLMRAGKTAEARAVANGVKDFLLRRVDEKYAQPASC